MQQKLPVSISVWIQTCICDRDCSEDNLYGDVDGGQNITVCFSFPSLL